MSSSHDHHDHASHPHSHSHAGRHSHVHGSTNETRLAWALLVIALFMGIEVVGGILSGSLALIADAVHMASDAVAIAMSWAALRIGRRPANAQLSYGYRRLEVLVAFVNGLTLLLISVGVTIEAIRRFAEPQPVLGPMMMMVAVAGLLSNVIAFLILNGGSRENLNMRSAWLHVLGDMVSSVAAIIAAGVIMLTGFSPIDPILSIFVSVLILRGAWQIVRSSARILLEATPHGLDLEAVRNDLLTSVPGTADVHHLHAWSLTAEHTVLTLHARPASGFDPLQLPAAIAARLSSQFGIDHATVQVEAASACTDALHQAIASHPENGEHCSDSARHTHSHDSHEDGHEHAHPVDEHALIHEHDEAVQHHSATSAKTSDADGQDKAKWNCY